MTELRYLNKFIYRYKWRLILGILFISISNVFAVLPAQIVRHAFDLVGESIYIYKLSGGVAIQKLIYQNLAFALLVFGIIVLVFALLRGLFMFMMRQTVIVMSRHVEFDMKNEIYNHFQKLNLSFYRRNNTGDLMARISEDVTRVRMYLGPAIMYSINLFTLIILVVSIMFTVNPELTLYVLLPLPFLAVSIYYVNHIIQLRSTRIQEQLSNLTTYTQEMFSGIRVLKAFASEPQIKKKFAEECDDYFHKSMSMVKVDALFFPLILLLVGLSMLITLYAGGNQVMGGFVTPGNIAEFFIYVNLMSWPVAAIGWVTSIVQRAEASQRRINEFLKEVPEINSKGGEKIKINGSISFDNVSLKYPETGIQALKNVSFRAHGGQSIGIIGPTGSGKTTIAQVLMRSFDPDSGSVLINDKDLRNIDLGYYRSQIGYVPQDDFLFSDTIANNMLFGHSSIKPVEEVSENTELYDLLKNISEITDVYKDIKDFPEGFNTRIGERGVSLSGGQKQRVAVARAIIGKPDLLILDDCFSAIDTYTEARILSNLSDVLKGRTSVIISHRVSTVKNADLILVMDQGRIIEQGKHEELISNKGYYHKLFTKQQVEKEFYQKHI